MQGFWCMHTIRDSKFRAMVDELTQVLVRSIYYQDQVSLMILLEGPGLQGTNEEVSPDTSRC